MWLIAEYLPTALFSLRMSNATNAAAKTLLLPSPYCVKMTLLDASFRRDGVEATKPRFEWIKPLEVRVEPPAHAVVNGCFVKIQKYDPDKKRFIDAFALREYVAYDGNLRLAFRVADLSQSERDVLSGLLLQINQLGKRGCFVQLVAPPKQQEKLPPSFATPITASVGMSQAALLQPLDDMQPNATLPQIDAFSDTRVSQRDLIRRNVPTLVPYQRRETSKGFTYYERRDQ